MSLSGAVCVFTGLDYAISNLTAKKMSHSRLFVDSPLGPGLAVALSSAQAHYLVRVIT